MLIAIRGDIVPLEVICPTCEAEIEHQHLVGYNRRSLEVMIDNCLDCLGTQFHPIPSTEL